MTERRPVALITGATSGIGRHAAQALVKAGWTVHTASRTVSVSEAGPSSLIPHRLDLGRLASVRSLVEDLSDQRLDAIVCNAGISAAGPLRHTVDGFERNVGVNHVGHFELARGLLPALAQGARVVVVTSGAHRLTEDGSVMKAPGWPSTREVLRPERDDPRMRDRRYATSKLCNALFAFELARRIEAGETSAPTDTEVVLYEPGFVPGTGLATESPGVAGFLFRWVLPVVGRLVGMGVPPARAGSALARLVTERDRQVGGALYEVDERIPVPPASRDEARARELWNTTAALVDALGADAARAAPPTP